MFKIFNTGSRDDVNYVLYYTAILQLSYQIDLRLEIRSMERGICPIAVFYFALKRSFFNIKNVIDQQRYKCYQILGHMTSSVTLQ